MLPKHPWLQQCLEHLERLPQIRSLAVVEPFWNGDILADGKLTIQTDQQLVEYIFVIKSGITSETVDIHLKYLHHFKQHLDQPSLLISDRLSNFVIDQLLENNINFLDTEGNVYLNHQDFYILQKLASSTAKITLEPLTIDTLKLAYVLLQNPKRLLEEQSELSCLAGLDLESTDRELELLHSLGYLDRQPGNRYRIADYIKLFERWEIGYQEILYPLTFIYTCKLKTRSFESFSHEIVELANQHQLLVGGELGAAIATQHLKPSHMTLYLPQTFKELERSNYLETMFRLGLIADTSGNITLLRQFNRLNQWSKETVLVDPLLLHAELSLTPDDRLKETACRIYKQYISSRREEAESF